jgi:hypothetical protein
MTKYFCDYCKKEMLLGESFRILFWTWVEKSTKVSICHDCYWKIQGFVKGLYSEKTLDSLFTHPKLGVQNIYKSDPTIMDEFPEKSVGDVKFEKAPCCPNSGGAIGWNPFNNAVQCHACGQVYDMRPSRVK